MCIYHKSADSRFIRLSGGDVMVTRQDKGVVRSRSRVRRLSEFCTSDNSSSFIAAITPETAQKWLDATDRRNYRNHVPALVREYARLMRQGAWSICGEPIILDDQGCLRDGQNRLLAVIESGVTIQALVEVVNAQESARQVA